MSNSAGLLAAPWEHSRSLLQPAPGKIVVAASPMSRRFRPISRPYRGSCLNQAWFGHRGRRGGERRGRRHPIWRADRTVWRDVPAGARVREMRRDGDVADDAPWKQGTAYHFPYSMPRPVAGKDGRRSEMRFCLGALNPREPIIRRLTKIDANAASASRPIFEFRWARAPQQEDS
jgi:hypothetical protein